MVTVSLLKFLNLSRNDLRKKIKKVRLINQSNNDKVNYKQVNKTLHNINIRLLIT